LGCWLTGGKQASSSPSSFLPLLLLTSLTVFAAIVRIIATHNDLWLDEIISLRIANAVTTPWQIFSVVHSDNNHYLNTLFLYFVKTQNYAPVYRYLSVLWGVLLVPAGYWLLVRRSRVEALILAGILASSYPLIHFSSEARGYSGALLGSMLACAALARWLAPMAWEDGKGRSFFLGLTYGMAIVLAILSHLTACLIWFSLAVGSLITLVRRPRRVKWISLWMALNALPASVLAALYFLDLRYLTQLGGPPMTVAHGLGRLLAMGLGWPAKDAATVWVVLVPLIGLTVPQLAAERKAGEPLSILLALIYLLPLLCVLLLQPVFFSTRHFLVILPFVYASVAMLLARLVRTRMGRIALVAALALFLAGQTLLYAKFLPLGRGQFTAALQYMTTHTPLPRLSVASNQDFRSALELAYYAPLVLRHQQLLYVPPESRASLQPEWYILHQEGYEAPGPAAFDAPGEPTWHRVAYFGASELSGQAWTIYSHQPID
jgi:hypothetical protein